MAQIVFNIPSKKEDLLSAVNSNYKVKDVIIVKEIVPKLKDAQTSLREEGPNFILDHFDTYYSVLHHANNLRPDVIDGAYRTLQKATSDLNDSIKFLLDDPESLNDEIKATMVTVLKMLVYIYIQFIVYIQDKQGREQDDLLRKGRKQPPKSHDFSVNKSQALNTLNDLIQREINLFWEPPIVEHDFVGMLAELCFTLLQAPSIKQEKNVVLDIFGVFGNLIKSYDYGKTFVSRLIQCIRMHEHVVHCIIKGIEMIVSQFNCQKLIHHFVKEATEWQIDETFQDVQGTRCCSIFLTELAVAMPKLFLPEVMYLDKYLAHQSQSLRISILNVMNEILLKVLTNHELSNEEREIRDEFLLTIMEHICDVSALVRSKVIQNLGKLQKENAIPLGFQVDVLKEIIEHLQDKAAAVRKSAVHCITTFLEHNPFGANLQLKKCKQNLADKKELLEKMEATYAEQHLAKIAEREMEWAEFEHLLKAEMEKMLKENNDDEENEDEEEQQIDSAADDAVQQIRNFLAEKKFTEAFKICLTLKNGTNLLQYLRSTDESHKVTMYMNILQSIFINKSGITDEVRTGAGLTQEDINKIQSLENIIKYLENTVAFLEVLDSAIPLMKQLLFSQSMSDTNEAIQFFVTAYQFQIDHATDGVLEMLKIMRCSEQDRHTAVVEAFKKIYLVTDTKNLVDHTTTILNRLLSLLKDIAYENLDDFQNIVTEWTSRGILDNSIVDRCWHFFTQREQISDEDARAAAEILRMAAMGRSTIITKNINVVSQIMFSEQHKTDMMFLASSFRLLAVAGLEKIDVQGKNPPFRIQYTDEIFQHTVEALIKGFFSKQPYYSEAMQAGLDFIFRVCSNPLLIGDIIMKQISEKIKHQLKDAPLLITLCELLGCMALKILGYLDNSAYREMKRRNYLRDEQKKNKKSKNTITPKKVRESLLDVSRLSNNSLNESILMGAEAEDVDAEFILSVLENDIVSKKAVLGKWSPLIITICLRPDLYNNHLLQQAAATALMRFMLVSGKFCSENIRLLFTIMEQTSYPQLKCTILIHCADLLTRFPNILEPWTPKMYSMLKDPEIQVRKTAFFSLANLLLRSMIRAHTHISEMAICLVDENEEINEMCKSFFLRIEQKEHNLVNVIPDIFSHLVRMMEQVDEPNLRFIMKFLFGLIDASKKMENVVDRFCCKYTQDDDMRLNRNITYCLSLVTYNDKALRKLHEKFPMYKHHMHDAEIYSTFKQILSDSVKNKVGKTDLQPIAADIEECIASVFELNENGQPSKPPPIPKSAKKPRRGLKSKKSRKQTSDSEDDEEESGRPKRMNSKKQDSGSEDEEVIPRGKAKRKGSKKQASDESEDEVFLKPKGRSVKKCSRASDIGDEDVDVTPKRTVKNSASRTRSAKKVKK